MIPDGSYTAVVDRFEAEQAALELTGDDERYEHTLARIELPEAARHTDAVLNVEIEDGAVVELRYEAAETERREENAQSRFDRLSERAAGSDDDEKDE